MHDSVSAEATAVAPTVGKGVAQEPEQPPVTEAADEGSTKGAGRRWKRWGLLLAVGLVGLLVGAWYLTRSSVNDDPPLLKLAVDQPITGGDGIVATNWVDPAAIAAHGDTIYVLDSGNNRIVAVNHDGEVVDVLCEQGDCAFLLDAPQAMRIHGDKIYVANSGSAEIVVLTLDGQVDRRIPLPVAEDGTVPEVAGLAIAPTGLMFVSDRATDRVLRFGVLGEFQRYVAQDQGDDPRYQLTDPAGLTLDFAGNLYVADSGNGRVQKFSPEDRLLTSFSMIPDDPTISIATDVAVAEDGTVFFTDTKRTTVQVFSQSGRYLGILGLADGTRGDSPGVLQVPVSLDVEADQLYIMDAASGLFMFEFHPAYWTTR